MPALDCPIDGCPWKSQNLEAEFAGVLNTALGGHLQHAHPPNSDTVAKPEKLPRPTVSKGITTEEWGFFKSLWGTYKVATKLANRDACIQLLACCDPELRRDLYRMDNSIEDKGVDAILDTMKSLCVRQENVMVSRLTLHNLRQDRDEGVRNFAARIRGQADVCKFTVRCSCDPGMDVSFTDQMVRDVLIRGLSDLDIQQEILGNENQDLDLEHTISLIEAKEAGRRSQASIIGEGAHMISQHKKKVNKTETIQNRKARCEKCGQSFTRPLGFGGKVRPHKMCKQCFKQGTSSTKDGASLGIDMSGHVADNGPDSICAATSNHKRGRKTITLHHHVFSNGGGWQQWRWVAATSLVTPTDSVTHSICM